MCVFTAAALILFSAIFAILHGYPIDRSSDLEEEEPEPVTQKYYDPDSGDVIEQMAFPNGMNWQKIIPPGKRGSSNKTPSSKDNILEQMSLPNGMDWQKMIPADKSDDDAPDSNKEYYGKNAFNNDLKHYVYKNFPPPHPLPPPPLKLKREEENAKSLALALGIGIPCLILVISALVIGYFLYRRWRRKQRAGSIYAASTAPIVCKHQNIYSKPLSGMLSGSSEKCILQCILRSDYRNSADLHGQSNLISTQKFKDCEVAIKMLPSFADDIARSDFQQEINFMKSLNYHPHLVSMLGYVIDPKNPLLLVEFCHKGDLLHLIRDRKIEIMQAYENGSGLRIRDLLSFSWQISNGLEYLSSVGCIHRDIALRNVLVDDTMTCKIGDFGLCRLTDNLLYTARGGRLPLRWMAPESLRSFEYSFQSDVWSYGILLYELFTFGEVPYGTIDNSEILQFLESGRRLEKPDYCPPEIYSIMRECWEENGIDRPSFTKICAQFVAIIEKVQPDYGYVQALVEER